MKKINPISVIELYHIGLALWWGVCLTLPFDTFSMGIYASMKNLAPDYVWGIAAFIIALGQFLSMRGKFKRLLPMGLAMASFYWSFVACMFIINDIQTNNLNTGSGSYLLLAIMIMWLSNNVGGGRYENNPK